MKKTTKSIVAMLTVLLSFASYGLADTTFRGIALDQGGNRMDSQIFDRLKPLWMDVEDNFSRTGQLDGSEADTWQVGFVAPQIGLPVGPLQGQYAEAHGRWNASDYYVNGSGVERVTGAGLAIATTPWQIELGRFYNLEATANVAAGETISIGFLGDVDHGSPSDLLTSTLGQLVLGITRGSGLDQDQLSWTIAWDDNGIRKSAHGVTTAAIDRELTLQLGWDDSALGAAGDDTFDAWIDDGTTNKRLLSDSMGNAISVQAIGFQIDGLNTTLGSFTSAVPEPATGLMGLFGIIATIAASRRRY